MKWFKYHTHSFISVAGDIEVMAVATQNIEKFLHCMPRGGQQNHIISMSHNIQGQTSNIASYPACTDGLNETTDISVAETDLHHITLYCCVVAQR